MPAQLILMATNHSDPSRAASTKSDRLRHHAECRVVRSARACAAVSMGGRGLGWG